MRIRAQTLVGTTRYAIFELNPMCRVGFDKSNPSSIYELMNGISKMVRQAVYTYKTAGRLVFTTYDAMQREQAYRLTPWAVANSNFIVYAKAIGAAGDVVRIELVPGAPMGVLAVSVVGNDITVTLSNPIVDTATQVVAAINAHPAAAALVHAVVAEGNSGAGVVQVLPIAALSGTAIFAPSLLEFCATQAHSLYLYVLPYSTAAAGVAANAQVITFDEELIAYLHATYTAPTIIAEAFRSFECSLFVEEDGYWSNWFDPRPTAPTWRARP